jgi:NAD(P)-dependent dehydrogenase (short-subunit alcohol dehydrogenase family)
MKVAIVTGALGGIGKESVKGLCHAGYTVVGMDVAKEITDRELSEFDFSYMSGDLTDTRSRESLLALAREIAPVLFPLQIPLLQIV